MHYDRAPCTTTRCAPLRQALPVEWPLQTEARHIFGKDRILGPGFVPQAAPLRCSRRIEHPVYLVARNDECSPVRTHTPLRPRHRTYGLRVPAFCVLYVAGAQGSWCATVRTLYAHQPRACRTYRAAWQRRWNPFHPTPTPTLPLTRWNPFHATEDLFNAFLTLLVHNVSAADLQVTCRWRVGRQPLAHRAATSGALGCKLWRIGLQGAASSPPHLRGRAAGAYPLAAGDRGGPQAGGGALPAVAARLLS